MQTIKTCRGVAQLGSASVSYTEGREFKSHLRNQISKRVWPSGKAAVFQTAFREFKSRSPLQSFGLTIFRERRKLKLAGDGGSNPLPQQHLWVV